MSKSKSKKMAKAQRKQNTVVPVTSSDLTLTESGGVLTCNLPDDTQWAGIDNFPSQTSNAGASGIFEAERNYTTVASGKETHCNVQGSGNYRVWSEDFNNNIHLSNWIVIP